MNIGSTGLVGVGRSFDGLIGSGIKKIYSEDKESQEHYISTILSHARGRDGLKDVPDIFWKCGCFFVPNEEYMLEYFGSGALDPMFDLYVERGNCIWNNYLVFPVRSCGDRVVGLYGFNPVVRMQNRESGEKNPVYLYSNSRMFRRANYVFSCHEIFVDGIRDGLIFITDGLFDCLSMMENGFKCASVMGSTVSSKLLVILSVFDVVYLLVDNDDAGVRLLKTLKRYAKNVFGIFQCRCKDADDVLNSEFKAEYVSRLRGVVESKPKYDVVIQL